MSEAGFLMPIRSISNRTLVAFAAGWILFQALFPLRHFLYPGWVEWTNEGHRFAWRMKLTDRSSAGLVLAVHVAELNTVHVPNLQRYLPPPQFSAVSTRPDLIQQLAWQLASLYKKELGVREVKVFAYAPSTLNNRRSALLIDPTVDLAGTQSTLWHDAWVNNYNPNPLRRLEDVDMAEVKTKPALEEVFSKMQLPQPKACYGPIASTPALSEDTVCSLD